MDIFVQLLMNSLQISSVYILFSLGLTLVFGVMRVVNFAHGEFFTFVLLLMSACIAAASSAHLPVLAVYGLATTVSIGATLVLGKLLYEYAFRRFQRDMVGSFVLSVGLSLLIQGILLEVFGGAPRKLPGLIDGTVNILGGAITIERLVLSGLAIVVAAGMCLFIAYTRFGKALRAVAEDHEAAMLQGIPYRRIAQYGFLCAALLAAVAGALMAPVSVVTPVIGNSYLIKGFIAIVIGGLGSIPGAILGSVILAVIEGVGGFYFDPTTASIAVFVIAVLVLLVRPKGLLGNG
ncbi:branched-chain amino acid ABC transporter permease [Paraburkholderia fungorum]|uniref:branched-chain amino acid ABC transporter permease n=1 Tax=Paraburkholderia fungorum TaxID=134537 RepID=UPI002097840E|nr:branched-chain amino acid ABC transporter permease [Paraburkholderia fungorum]USX06828.1 branched-chain amino acid ABC transporter permease [Paraburkholderia fungorum]